MSEHEPEQPKREPEQQPEGEREDVEEIQELLRPDPWSLHEEVGDLYTAEISDDGQIERAEKLTLHPKVWIGCLAAYNNGTLHGDWVDAAVAGEDLVASAQRILATSPEPDAEEWAIFDFDEFGDYQVDQYDPLEHVAAIARRIEEHGHPISVWAQLHDGDEEMVAQFEDAFLGEYESAEDWAREVLDELNLDAFLKQGSIPEAIRPYVSIDYAGWARDARLSGDIDFEDAPGGGIYVFRAT